MGKDKPKGKITAGDMLTTAKTLIKIYIKTKKMSKGKK